MNGYLIWTLKLRLSEGIKERRRARTMPATVTSLPSSMLHDPGGPPLIGGAWHRTAHGCFREKWDFRHKIIIFGQVSLVANRALLYPAGVRVCVVLLRGRQGKAKVTRRAWGRMLSRPLHHGEFMMRRGAASGMACGHVALCSILSNLCALHGRQQYRTVCCSLSAPRAVEQSPRAWQHKSHCVFTQA